MPLSDLTSVDAHPVAASVPAGLRASDLELARRLPLFSGIGPQLVERVLHGARVERHRRGALLFEEGASPIHLHAVLRGTVELYTAQGARECGLLLLSPGDIFMPAATLFEEPYLNSARTLRNSRILLIDARTVREEFRRSHELAMAMSKALAGHFRMATRHVIDLKCRTGPQRLAAFLLRQIDESRTLGSAELPVSKRTLASRVGMTAETLSRTFQTLADHGLLVSGNRAILRDREKIEAFCGTPPYSEPDEEGLGVHAF